MIKMKSNQEQWQKYTHINIGNVCTTTKEACTIEQRTNHHLSYVLTKQKT